MNTPDAPTTVPHGAPDWPEGWPELDARTDLPPVWRSTLQTLRTVGRDEPLHLRALTAWHAADPRLEPRLTRLLQVLGGPPGSPLSVQGCSHAVSLMGFGTVALLTGLLMLLQRQQDDAAVAKHQRAPIPPSAPAALSHWRTALMAAVLARALSPAPAAPPRPWLLALLHHLPDLLQGVPPPDGTEAAPAESPEPLRMTASALAHAWGWPDALVRALQALEPGGPDPAVASPLSLASAATGTGTGASDQRLSIALAIAPQLLACTHEARIRLAQACAARAEVAGVDGMAGHGGPAEPEVWCALFERALDDWEALAQTLALSPLPAQVRLAPLPEPPPAPAAAPSSPSSAQRRPPQSAAPQPTADRIPDPTPGTRPVHGTAHAASGVSADPGARPATRSGGPETSDGLTDSPSATQHPAAATLAAAAPPVASATVLGSAPSARTPLSAPPTATSRDRVSADGTDAGPGTPPAARTSPTAPTAPTTAPAASLLSRAPPRPPLSALPALVRGIEDLSRGLLGDAPLGELVEPALLTALQALQWQRLMLCLPERGDGPLVPRHAVGERLRGLLPQVRIAWQAPTDAFGLLVREQRDTVVADALRPGRTAHLPAWFVEHAGAAGFVALPLGMARGAGSADPTPGLLYGDVPLSHRLVLDEPTLGQLRTLRNLFSVARRLRSGAPGRTD